MQATPLAIATPAAGPSAKPSATRGSEGDDASGSFAELLTATADTTQEEEVTAAPISGPLPKLPHESGTTDNKVEPSSVDLLAPETEEKEDTSRPSPELSVWLAALLQHPATPVAAKSREPSSAVSEAREARVDVHSEADTLEPVAPAPELAVQADDQHLPLQSADTDRGTGLSAELVMLRGAVDEIATGKSNEATQAQVMAPSMGIQLPVHNHLAEFHMGKAQSTSKLFGKSSPASHSGPDSSVPAIKSREGTADVGPTPAFQSLQQMEATAPAPLRPALQEPAATPPSQPVVRPVSQDLSTTLPLAATAISQAVISKDTAQAVPLPMRMEAFVQPDVHSPSFAPAFSARIATMVHGGIESARVHLNPVEMGPVSVQMSLEGQQVRVDMTASLAATRMALEQALPSLAGALREAGFTLNGGGVHQPASDGRSQNFGDTGAQGNPQGSAAGSAFGQSAGTPGRQGDPSQPSPQSPQRQDAFSGVVTVGGDTSDISTRVASLQSHRAGTRLVDVFA